MFRPYIRQPASGHVSEMSTENYIAT